MIVQTVYTEDGLSDWSALFFVELESNGAIPRLLLVARSRNLETIVDSSFISTSEPLIEFDFTDGK